jgi:hypothetical protein
LQWILLGFHLTYKGHAEWTGVVYGGSCESQNYEMETFLEADHPQQEGKLKKYSKKCGQLPELSSDFPVKAWHWPPCPCPRPAFQTCWCATSREEFLASTLI